MTRRAHDFAEDAGEVGVAWHEVDDLIAGFDARKRQEIRGLARSIKLDLLWRAMRVGERPSVPAAAIDPAASPTATIKIRTNIASSPSTRRSSRLHRSADYELKYPSRQGLLKDASMLIGEATLRAGIVASTLRYYEREGLLPPPARSAKRRVYDAQDMPGIRIIQLVRSAGFSIAVARLFLGGDSTASMPTTRWRAAANRKLQDMNALIAIATQMKRLLQSSLQCSCSTIEECERLLLTRCARDRLLRRNALASIGAFSADHVEPRARKRPSVHASARNAWKSK